MKRMLSNNRNIFKFKNFNPIYRFIKKFNLNSFNYNKHVFSYIKFFELKKSILEDRKPKKNEDIENNIFSKNKFIFNKLKFDFDPDDRVNSTMGYNIDTGKSLPKNKETIIGYSFNILSFKFT